jgi:hypothetical protein
MAFKYIPKPTQKLKEDYSRRKHAGLNSFNGFEDFKNWDNNQEFLSI